MITIKTITMKNFLSVGNVTQTIKLNKPGLNLVLGENLDLGGNGSRNGTGKTSLLQAISYGLYGQSLTNIKKENLVNKINGKNMFVSIEFDVSGHSYRIERGRKPNFFRYVVDNKNISDEETDEAQGENKETQKEINQLLGMSHTMFKHIIALNTYTEPFLSLGAAKQREIIEELLGITLLSQKAEALKEKIKSTKSAIDQEEFQIKTIKQSNDRIQSTLDDVVKKSNIWENTNKQNIIDINNAISQLDNLDIEKEIQSHKDNDVWKQLNSVKTQVDRDINAKRRHLNLLTSQFNTTVANYESAKNHSCPTCGQGLHLDTHEKIKQDLEGKILTLDTQMSSEQKEIDSLATDLSSTEEALLLITQSNTIYKTLEQALNHRNTLDQLRKDLEKEQQLINPYTDQKNSIGDTIQTVSYETLNVLASDKEHQEFLLKLLTNKDSFIRKKIIDQNLAYLNSRLNEYLEKLGLPHQIKFLNDLSVEITLLGQDLDFYNLSRGEGTRLILGTNMAFRDIFENTNHAINLIFIDELLDNGLDMSGLEGAVEILKKFVRERKKDVFVISHREELINRVDDVLNVVKENGFTTFLQKD